MHKKSTSILTSLIKHELMPSANKDWRNKYATLISELKRQPSAFHIRKCHDELQLFSDYTSFTRALDSLNFEKASSVIDYIFDNNIIAETLAMRGELIKEEQWSFFHGLRSFLEMDDRALIQALEQLPGAYQVWRRSVSIPGDYVKGAIFIEKSKDLKVLTVEMIQRFYPRTIVPNNPVRGRQETLSGYIFRQSSGRYIMVLRQVGRKHLRISFFNQAAYDENADGSVGKLDWMQGQVIGLDNHSSVSTDVYVERVSDETKATGDKAVDQLLETINVYPEDEVPENIIKKLKSNTFKS